jgi:hypothetical protein
LLAYAGSAGESVADGPGRHGLYTEALLPQLARSELSMTEAVLAAHADVRVQAGFRQTPQLSTTLNSDLYLHNPPQHRKTFVFVVGVGAYQELRPLLNPRNDAESIASLLRKAGYEVNLHIDLETAALAAVADQFIAAIKEYRQHERSHFGRSEDQESLVSVRAAYAGISILPNSPSLKAPDERLPAAPAGSLEPAQVPIPNSLAIVYFAGMGIEVASRSLFAGVDARPGNRSDIDQTWFDVNNFILKLETVASARVIILDYCRSDPFGVR